MKIQVALTIQLLWTACLFGQTINDSGFESKSKTDWTFFTATDTEVNFDSTHSYNGTMSMMIKGNSEGWFRQSIEYKHNSNKPERLRITAYIKSELTQGSARLFARAIRDNGVDRFQTMGVENITGQTGWNKYFIDIITDSRTKEIRIGGILEGQGQVYFDNFQLEGIQWPSKEVMSSEIKGYTDKYLQIINDNALYKDSIDFQALVNDVWVLTKSANSIKDCTPVLVYTLGRLQDGHSFYMTKQDVDRLESDSDDQEIIYPHSKQIGNIGYLYIPQFNSFNATITRKFADTLQYKIRQLDKAKIKGWVIDLRNNGGGNCWPMIAGIGPLLGDDTYGYVISRDGKKEPWSYANGAAIEGDTIATKVTSPYILKSKSKATAVLINEGTASSAEVIAVSFIGLPTTKLFGSPSYGATTTNEEFRLEDGSMMFLCSGVYMSRTERRFGGKIYPDKIVESKPDSEEDLVLAEAINWIKSQK